MELFRQMGQVAKTRSFWFGIVVTGVAALVEVWVLEKSYK